MSRFLGKPPIPFYKHFFVIDGVMAQEETFTNLFTLSLDRIGSCLFVHEEKEGRQEYIFYAIVGYKSPFPSGKEKSNRFVDMSFFSDTSSKAYSQSWWLYIEKGYTTDEFLHPNNTYADKDSIQYIHVDGTRAQATQNFFSRIVQYYHQHTLRVIDRHPIGVGPLYGQSHFFPSKTLKVSIDTTLLETYISQPYAKNISSMIIRGGSILKSANDWVNPYIGREDPTMVMIVRGVLWQFMMAYSGFELLWKGAFVFVQRWVAENKDSLEPKVSSLFENLPDRDLKGFTDVYFDILKSVVPIIYDTKKFQNECVPKYLCFQSDKTALKEYWEKQQTQDRKYLDLSQGDQGVILKFTKKSPKTPNELVSLATSIRHAIAHGMLSPSKIVQWYMFPSMIALLRGIIWLGQELIQWMDRQLVLLEQSSTSR